MTESNLNKNIETIPLDKLINIKVSGAYYASIQNLFYMILQEKAMDDPTGYKTAKLLEELGEREPKDKWETQVVLLFSLLRTIEEAAKSQNIISLQPEEKIMSTIPEIFPESFPES